jgi:hypothetical protein
MILALVLVGDQFIEEAIPYIKKYVGMGWNIEILTNKPQVFGKLENTTTHLYENKIFSYFQKILFPLKITEKYKSGVLYMDSSVLLQIPDEFILNFKECDDFLYYGTWPMTESFKCLETDPYFKYLIEFFNREGVNTQEYLLPIIEWIYYIPYNQDKIYNLIFDTERIKPVFEFTSIMCGSKYVGIGSGEGLGLSYVLDKNGIKTKKFQNLIF